MTRYQLLGLVIGWILTIFIALLALKIIWKIFKDEIDLDHLISDAEGYASLSRFQFLVFTFVVAMSLFYLIVISDPPEYPIIPNQILALIGISGGSYVISKGIQGEVRSPTLTITGSAGTAPLGGPPMQFQAKATGLVDETVIWSLDPPEGRGTIDANTGIYTPPPTTQEDARGKKVVIQAVSKEDMTLKDTETIELT
jgi:hypothetical protein